MEGSEAKFSVPVSFEGNSGLEGHSGAAVAVDGVVSAGVTVHVRCTRALNPIPNNSIRSTALDLLPQIPNVSH